MQSVSSYASNRPKENDASLKQPQFKLQLVEYEGGDSSAGSKLRPPKPPGGRLSPINPSRLKTRLQLPPLQLRGSRLSRAFQENIEKNYMSNDTNNSLVHSHRDDPLSWHAAAHQSSASLQQFQAPEVPRKPLEAGSGQKLISNTSFEAPWGQVLPPSFTPENGPMKGSLLDVTGQLLMPIPEDEPGSSTKPHLIKMAPAPDTKEKQPAKAKILSKHIDKNKKLM